MSGRLTETLIAWDIKYRQGIYIRIEELQWAWLRKRVAELEDKLSDLYFQLGERKSDGQAEE